jgi:hypothetical protein
MCFSQSHRRRICFSRPARWLDGVSKLSRDDMRVLECSDDRPEIDICKSSEKNPFGIELNFLRITAAPPNKNQSAQAIGAVG